MEWTLGVAFVFGAGAGIVIHRFIMAMILHKSPDTLCTYCEWLGRKRSRHKK